MNTPINLSATATQLSLPLSALAGTVATILAALTGHPAATGAAILGAGLTGYLTATRRYRQRLRHAVAQARRDPLTGLPNRALADELLDQATHTGTPLTIALIDVNGLHTINTNLGHAAGDQYLTTVAERLTRATPPEAVLVRHGGDEFALLAPGTGPQQLADRIGAALAGRAVIGGYRIQPRASVGIAASDTDQAVDARHVRARADSALYTAKRDGGNRIRLFDPGRDAEPAADGTRPLLRRRDINPVAEAGMAWQPSPGDELIPVLLSPDDLRAVVQALTTAAKTWAQTGTDAAAGARRPATPGSSTPAGKTIDAVPAGYAAIARSADDQHTRLLQRLRPIIEAADTLDDVRQTAAPSSGPAAAVSVSGVELTGVSAAFTPADIDALISAAANAVHGHRDDLSSRQRELAARAWDLLHRADGD